MTKEQWRAICNYSKKNIHTPQELLQQLKENGTVSIDANLEELGDYPKGKSYKEMILFLEEN